MGIGIFGRSCSTNYQPYYVPTPAPDPDPTRWGIIKKVEFDNAYVLKVRYYDCTNFEGIKVMVFKGKYVPRKHMDPHFCESKNSPIARFIPTQEGWDMALALASNL